MSDMPKEIWAIDGADQAVKEIWQPDNVWGDYAVKYIRADLVQSIQNLAQKAHNRGYEIDPATILFLIKDWKDET